MRVYPTNTLNFVGLAQMVFEIPHLAPLPLSKGRGEEITLFLRLRILPAASLVLTYLSQIEHADREHTD
jgi:hypothetical protein